MTSLSALHHASTSGAAFLSAPSLPHTGKLFHAQLPLRWRRYALKANMVFSCS
jgi:hypothetical protein